MIACATSCMNLGDVLGESGQTVKKDKKGVTYLHEAPAEVNFVEKGKLASRVWGLEALEIYCLTGAQFQFGKA